MNKITISLVLGLFLNINIFAIDPGTSPGGDGAVGNGYDNYKSVDECCEKVLGVPYQICMIIEVSPFQMQRLSACIFKSEETHL